MPTLMRVKSGLSTTQVVEGKRHATQGRSFVPQPTVVTMWTLATDWDAGWMCGFHVKMGLPVEGPCSGETLIFGSFDLHLHRLRLDIKKIHKHEVSWNMPSRRFFGQNFALFVADKSYLMQDPCYWSTTRDLLQVLVVEPGFLGKVLENLFFFPFLVHT